LETLAIILMLCGAVAQAGHVSAQRYLIGGKKILSKYEPLVIQYAFRTVALLAIMPFWSDFGTMALSSNRIFWIGVAGVIGANLWIQYANVHARSKPTVDVSFTEPIQSLTPFLVTLAAISFGEHPSIQGWAGIALISFGNLLHLREGMSPLSREYWQPFVQFMLPRNFEFLGKDQQEELLERRSAILWSYGSACVGAVGLIFDATLVRHGSVALGFALQGVFLGGWFFFLSRRSNEKRASLADRVRAHIVPVLILCIAWTLMVLFTNTAFRLAPVGYIGTLKRLYLPILLIFSVLFLGEKKAKLRIMPNSLITVGAVFLAFDGSFAKLVDRFEDFLDFLM